MAFPKESLEGSGSKKKEGRSVGKEPHSGPCPHCGIHVFRKYVCPHCGRRIV